MNTIKSFGIVIIAMVVICLISNFTYKIEYRKWKECDSLYNTTRYYLQDFKKVDRTFDGLFEGKLKRHITADTATFKPIIKPTDNIKVLWAEFDGKDSIFYIKKDSLTLKIRRKI